MIYADIKYSKQLADLFPESEWWYHEFYGRQWKKSVEYELLDRRIENRYTTLPSRKYSIYPALTTDMLLERLPSTIENKPFTLVINKGIVDYHASYPNIKGGVHFCDKSISNVLSKMLIYLKENDLLKEGNNG